MPGLDCVVQNPQSSIYETWTVIAQRIGLSRELGYRALASLEKNGVIERSATHGDERTERLRLL